MILFLFVVGLFIGFDVWELFVEGLFVFVVVLLEDFIVDGFGVDVEVDKEGWFFEVFCKDIVDVLVVGFVWVVIDLRIEEVVWNMGGFIEGFIELLLFEDDLFCLVIFECYKR